MTMNAMDEYLKAKGFAVVRTYDRGLKAYKFAITKDGLTKSYYWNYPTDVNTDKDLYQKESMDRMVKEFHEQKLIRQAIRAGVNGLYSSLEPGYHYEPPAYVDTDSCHPRTLSISEYRKAVVDLANYIERRYSNMAISIPELNNRNLKIKDVIFHDPATIVLWSDGTKTVVKAVNEPFDREKGLAMAVAKKFFGNKGNYYNSIKKWLKSDE